jgi:hypothetical protein
LRQKTLRSDISSSCCGGKCVVASGVIRSRPSLWLAALTRKRSLKPQISHRCVDQSFPSKRLRASGSLKRAAESAGHGDEDASSDKTGDQIADPSAAERDAEEAHKPPCSLAAAAPGIRSAAAAFPTLRRRQGHGSSSPGAELARFGGTFRCPHQELNTESPIYEVRSQTGSKRPLTVWGVGARRCNNLPGAFPICER